MELVVRSRTFVKLLVPIQIQIRIRIWMRIRILMLHLLDFDQQPKDLLFDRGNLFPFYEKKKTKM